jgi:glyoxylase-like metal-dependent hydrolase (beta-lactamase superfamily II)
MLSIDDLIPIHTGDVTFPKNHPLAGQTGAIYAFGIRHDGGVVLFETGIGWDNAFIDKHYKPVHRPLLDVLADHGVHKDDIRAIVNSHLHFDHCGGNPLFPGVPIQVQAEELTAARTPYYTAVEWIDFPGARYDEHRGDYEIAEGVNVLATRGHTMGHQSLVVRTHQGEVILAGQAIYDRDECAYIQSHGKLPAGDLAPADEESCLDSALRLIRMRPRAIHFSHDSAVWSGAERDELPT